jgi:O-antigen/teichoic acid export membrane protein
MPNTENNKRIAKNTLLLYFRMFLSMGVSLYTSRIVLNTLGVMDFGIYNVVGGVVMMFSFMNSSMISATQRFLSFEIGKNDIKQLKKIFWMSINIHAIIAVVIFILAETIGLWFLNSKLIIPLERIEAANWVYQFSIFSFMFTIMGVPYDAMIIARERMNVYAYISIVEVILKLIIVLILVWIGYDKLKLYSFFVFFVSVVVWIFYKTYCNRNFKESYYVLFWDKKLYKTLMSYAGWNLFGNIASVGMGQGVNILLNLSFGPVVNAARGIAYQVNGAVNGFVGNFQMAMNPQIYKSYAADDMQYMQQLIFQGSKYSFFLLFFISLPILMETETILRWWLKNVPEYTVLFCRLVLVNTLIDCISGPLMVAAQATGKIKVYQSVIGGLLLLILPISYVFLRLGFAPQVTLYVSIIISVLALFSRLWIINNLINLSISKFTKSVLLPIFKVVLLSLIFPLIIKYCFEKQLINFLAVSFTSILSASTSIYLLGFRKEEQVFIKNKISKFIYYKNN